MSYFLTKIKLPPWAIAMFPFGHDKHSAIVLALYPLNQSSDQSAWSWEGGARSYITVADWKMLQCKKFGILRQKGDTPHVYDSKYRWGELPYFRKRKQGTGMRENRVVSVIRNVSRASPLQRTWFRTNEKEVEGKSYVPPSPTLFEQNRSQMRAIIANCCSWCAKLE